MRVWAAPETGELGIEATIAELRTVIGCDPLELPAGLAQIMRDPVPESRAETHVGVAWRDMELGPAKARRRIDRRVLPYRPLGASEPSDAQAVHLDELAGMVDFDVMLGLGVASRFRRGRIAGEETVSERM